MNAVEPGFAPGSVVSPLTEEYVDRMKERSHSGAPAGPRMHPKQFSIYARQKRALSQGLS